MSKIGIMGGTFDPIHNGHLMLGDQAYREYGLNQVWYMPSGTPPHKRNHHVTEGAMRLAMTELAVKEHEGFLCSDFEISRNGNTYTAQTLGLLREEYPEHTFYFIIGADSLYEIESWYEPARVLAQAVILVAGREYDKANRSMDSQIAHLSSLYDSDIRILHCEEMDISSAQLRQMIANGQSIEAFVPQKVADYIQAHGLYQEAEA
ncbi:MAG: nicotinate-nucleotide adenylyltransferase [Lacrimispora sp.]|uniref:nicotinate-nucleotide adenylyltransferase n=1 Tax=Lacrimispora sp. TaxID=2719234 RepID=UPI0039E504AA